MKQQFLKAARDLTSNPKKTLLVVFALILGIWGAGMVQVSYVLLMHDLQANYQRTAPAHLVFSSPDFEKLNLEQFRGKPDIETAEFRDFSLHRIEVRPEVWLPLSSGKKARRFPCGTPYYHGRSNPATGYSQSNRCVTVSAVQNIYFDASCHRCIIGADTERYGDIRERGFKRLRYFTKSNC